MDIYTQVVYNGPLLEEVARSTDELIRKLQEDPLDAVWEIGEGFVRQHKSIPTIMVFHGRFSASDYRFNIETNDPVLIDKLTQAIEANKGSYEYKELRTIRFGLSFRRALVKHLESGADSEVSLYLRQKYSELSIRPTNFDSIYAQLKWEEGSWISSEDLIHCTVELGFDIDITVRDR